jgi:hypothetical protein
MPKTVTAEDKRRMIDRSRIIASSVNELARATEALKVGTARVLGDCQTD